MLNPTGLSRYSGFGSAVSISGNTAIVGAYANDTELNDTGSVYVFDVTSGLQSDMLVATDGKTGDQFGWSVDISGNTAVIGSPSNDGTVIQSGSAYVFDVNTKNQLFEIFADDPGEEDLFGWSVAISGNTAIIGAHRDDDLAESSGSAYLFDISNTRELAKLTASDGTRDNFFGAYLDVDGDMCVVGAYGDYSAYLFTVPEPSTLTLNLLVALTALALARYRIRRHL